MPHTSNTPLDPDSPYTMAPSLLFAEAVSTSTAPVLFEMDSSEAVFFLTPVIGPTSICVMHMLTTWCKDQAQRGNDTFEITLPDLAASLGISQGTLRNTLERLRRFNFVHPCGGIPLRTEIQTSVRHYPLRWLQQLPDSARNALIDWQHTLGVTVS